MGSGASKPGTELEKTNGGPVNDDPQPMDIAVDSRLPCSNFRELFTLKNYWKTIRRNEKVCSKSMYFRYLKANPSSISRYPKLKNFTLPDSAESCSEPAFETIAGNYLKVGT